MKIKDLDSIKVYDLSDLNKKQRNTIYDWLVKNDVNWSGVPKSEFVKKSNDFLFYSYVGWDWASENHFDKNKVITNALELIEEEEPIFEDKKELMDIEVRYNEIKPSVFINNHYEDITINIKVPANQKVIISYEQL